MEKGELPMEPDSELNLKSHSRTVTWPKDDAGPTSTPEIPVDDVEQDAFFGDDSDNE
jgi:hypothetical protein